MCWLRCSWSIACGRCSNYIFILDLTPDGNGLGKNNCKTRNIQVLGFGALYIRDLMVAKQSSTHHKICTRFCLLWFTEIMPGVSGGFPWTNPEGYGSTQPLSGHNQTQQSMVCIFRGIYCTSHHMMWWSKLGRRCKMRTIKYRPVSWDIPMGC